VSCVEVKKIRRRATPPKPEGEEESEEESEEDKDGADAWRE